jgi:hypothetical protein
MKLLLRTQILCFLFTLFPVQESIAQQVPSEYRIQVTALPRVKLDSLKGVSSEIEKKLQLTAYILDQDNFYKIAVGDFYTFSQAREKLETVRFYYQDAWIIPAFHEFVVYPEIIKEPLEVLLQDKEIPGSDDVPPIPVKPEIVIEPDPALIVEEVPVIIEPELIFIEIPRVPSVKRRVFPRIYGGILYIDLHASTPATRYCDYYGFGVGLGNSYAITKNFLIDLSVDYNLANAFPIDEKHEVSGEANVLRITPAIIAGSNVYSKFGIYGKLGLSFFNYDYSYSMELKPGYSGGPASVDAALLERASTYGLDAGVGLRLFRRIEITFNTYYDLNERLLYSLNVGFVF